MPPRRGAGAGGERRRSNTPPGASFAAPDTGNTRCLVFPRRPGSRSMKCSFSRCSFGEDVSTARAYPAESRLLWGTTPKTDRNAGPWISSTRRPSTCTVLGGRGRGANARGCYCRFPTSPRATDSSGAIRKLRHQGTGRAQRDGARSRQGTGSLRPAAPRQRHPSPRRRPDRRAAPRSPEQRREHAAD